MGTEPSIDDRAIVAAVLQGDTDRFAQLVGRYHPALLRLAANRLGSVDTAEDAVQDAFVAAFRSLHTYKPEYSFRTWLWTILLNQCRRHGSRQVKRAHLQAGADGEHGVLEQVSAESPPDLSIMLNERNRLLRHLLEQLPETQADAVRLRFFGQLKYREIGDAMQCSVAAAKQRVRAGLRTMSELLRGSRLIDSVFPGDKS